MSTNSKMVQDRAFHNSRPIGS